MDIATSILVNLNKVFPRPKRFQTDNLNADKFITGNNPMTVDYFDIQVEKGKDYYHYRYSNYVDFSDKVVLDLGCGLGGGTFSYSKKDVKLAIGIELETIYLATGKKYMENKYGKYENIIFLNADATELPLQTNSVDIIIANDFMEHVSSPKETLKEVEKAAMVIRAYGHSTTETLPATPWKEFLANL